MKQDELHLYRIWPLNTRDHSLVIECSGEPVVEDIHRIFVPRSATAAPVEMLLEVPFDRVPIRTKEEAAALICLRHVLDRNAWASAQDVSEQSRNSLTVPTAGTVLKQLATTELVSERVQDTGWPGEPDRASSALFRLTDQGRQVSLAL